MTATQRIVAAAVVAVLWLAAIVAKHFFADIDTGAFTYMCIAALSALGIHAAGSSPAGRGDREGGGATPGALLLLAALAALVALSGCASVGSAGHASYSLTAKTDKEGNVSGYDLSVADGKEFASRTVKLETLGPVVRLLIEEGKSQAFKGQALAVKALSVLPTMGLQDILAPRDQ